MFRYILASLLLSAGIVSAQVTVTSPHAGDVYRPGDFIVIAWTAPGSWFVNIWFNSVGDTSWPSSAWYTLFNNIPNQSVVYWSAPDINSTHCRVRVADFFNYANGGVSGEFTISPYTGVNQHSAGLPIDYALLQSYPNPFNAMARIAYIVSVAGHVSLKVFDLQGREVATLVNGFETAGNHAVTWNAKDFASGVYFCRLQAVNGHRISKLVLIK